VFACALLATSRSASALKALAPPLAMAFAVLVYRDAARLNDLEDRAGNAVADLPGRSRVVLHLETRATRITWGAHALDRACIGHCFSYANYEPATRQFRLRASGDGPAVLAKFSDVSSVEHSGDYVVRARDLPLWLVYKSVTGRVGAVQLNQGDVVADVAGGRVAPRVPDSGALSLGAQSGSETTT